MTEPNRIECGIEELNQNEQVGFVFLQPVKHEPPKPVSPAPEPPRKHSDEFLSKNARINWGTHIAEPIYVDGKPTGEWRVRILKPIDRYGWRDQPVAWDAILPSGDAASEWGKSLRSAEYARVNKRN